MRRRDFLATLVPAGLFAGLAGCTTPQRQPETHTSRSQAGEDAADRQLTGTVGDLSTVGNTDPIPVSGVGLVWKLPGTGSKAPPGEWRDRLSKVLTKKKLNPGEFLDAPDLSCSLVLVNGSIPPGARKGDPIDVEITLPQGSRTTSLKGGVLFECELTPYTTTGDVKEHLAAAGVKTGGASAAPGLLTGDALAVARGPLVAGAAAGKPARPPADDAEKPRYTVAQVWGGGRVLNDRPYWVVLNDANQSYRNSSLVASRLNTAFHGASDGRLKLAESKTKAVVETQVPPAYRLNHLRFLTVARQIPLLPTPADGPSRRKLEQELLDPAACVAAAVKLEAFGTDSQHALRVGLESQSPWVRFASAEALAYLGDARGANELKGLAEGHPALRTHCLLALASLDDAAANEKLTELMAHPDPELRYGAFHALRSANEQYADEAVRGKLAGESFWVHQVAPNSPGLVHLRSDRRAEVVVFGAGGDLKGPFSLPVGSEFTVALPDGAAEATVTRVAAGRSGVRQEKVGCKPTVAGILQALGRLGGTYSEAVDLVGRLDRAKVLAGAVAVDAAPKGMPQQQLAAFAKIDPDLRKADVEVVRAGRWDGVLPASYDLPDETAGKDKPAPATDERSLSREPGRLFGPKYTPTGDPAAPPPPAPPAPATAGPDLARYQGSLLGRKK